MEAQTKVLTAHIPTSLAKKVDKLAEKLERSRAWVIKQALSAWVAEEEEHYKLTIEALKEVKSGQVVDHDDVEKWADSLTGQHPKPAPKCR
jgi:predicted transcriptional regulator